MNSYKPIKENTLPYFFRVVVKEDRFNKYWNMLVKSPDNAFLEFINEKKYKGSDTGFSYRQINYLFNFHNIKEERDSNKNWRKFNFRDVVFLKTLKELKNIGLKKEFWVGLHDVFYQGFSSSPVDLFYSPVDIATLLVYSGVKIFLVIDNDKNILFVDDFELVTAYQKSKFCIVINLNEIIADIKGEEVLYDKLICFEGLLSDKEKKIIEIIRNKEYKEIVIKKKGEKSVTIHAGKTENGEISEGEIIRMIQKAREGKYFGKVTIDLKGGVVVNLDKKDTFKI